MNGLIFTDLHSTQDNKGAQAPAGGGRTINSLRCSSQVEKEVREEVDLYNYSIAINCSVSGN